MWEGLVRGHLLGEGAVPRPEPGPPGRQHYEAQGAAIPLEPDCQERDLLPHLPTCPT